jgi:nucleotide-binding universal stress UspA family protein
MFRNILVAIDESATAWRALADAIDLAQALHARLTVLSVVPGLPPFAYRAGIDVAELEQEAERETERLLGRAVESVPAGVSVTSRLRHGPPAREILHEIDEGGHDLVVMGSRGRGRVRSNLLGSVGGDVHYHAHIPMLIVHDDVEETSSEAGEAA